MPTRASKGRPSRGTLSKARPSNAWMYFFGSQTDSLCYGCALLILHSKIRLCFKSSGCQNQTHICPVEFRTAEHPPRDTGREFEREPSTLTLSESRAPKSPSTRRDTLLAVVFLFRTKFQMVGHESPCPLTAPCLSVLGLILGPSFGFVFVCFMCTVGTSEVCCTRTSSNQQRHPGSVAEHVRSSWGSDLSTMKTIGGLAKR